MATYLHWTAGSMNTYTNEILPNIDRAYSYKEKKRLLQKYLEHGYISKASYIKAYEALEKQYNPFVEEMEEEWEDY